MTIFMHEIMTRLTRFCNECIAKLLFSVWWIGLIVVLMILDYCIYYNAVTIQEDCVLIDRRVI